jgi:hypothetical protein
VPWRGGGRRLLPLAVVLALVAGGAVIDRLQARAPRQAQPAVLGAVEEQTTVSSTVTETTSAATPTSITDFGRHRRAERPVLAPASFTGKRAPAVPPPKALSSAAGPKEGGVWAVLVGVDDYPGDSHDLRKAVADARAADAALAAYGVPAGRRLMLLDGQASVVNIRRGLEWLVAHAAPEATAVVFFAGHARQVLPGRRGGPVRGAVIGADGTDLLDSDIARILAGLEARTAWITMAACYGAEFDEVLAPGRVLTAASDRHEIAYENASLPHSYLVEYMVQKAMIEGRAPESVQDSFRWAATRIARDYADRQPVMIDRATTPVVLSQPGTRKAEAAPVPRSASTEPPAPEPEDAPSEPVAPPVPAPAPPRSCVLGLGLCGDEESDGG